MTETKTPAFNLHKKPEPLPDPSFAVVKKDGTWSIEMNGYTVLGGLSEKAATDLQHQIYLSVVEPIHRLNQLHLERAIQSSCANNPYMQAQRSRSFNDLFAKTTLG